MKVLITGGCGFVGTNLAIFLKSRNFNVNCLDNLSRKGSRYNLNLLRNKKIRNYKFDIHNFKIAEPQKTEKDMLTINGVIDVGIFSENKPQIVIVGNESSYRLIES